MLKKILTASLLMIGFSSAYAGDLSCGQTESTAQKTILGEVKKNQPSILDQVKSKQDAVTESKKLKDCDEHCAEHTNCTEHSEVHACDEHCGHHKNHDHKH